MIKITKGWHTLLKEEFEKEYFKNLLEKLTDEYSKYEKELYKLEHTANCY